jgi:NADH:ubiquinone oxidoreductase subunit F (NADH-binding)
MNIVCKALLRDELFFVTIKARILCLMTNFMRKFIFREEIGTCNLCRKGRQETVIISLIDSID